MKKYSRLLSAAVVIGALRLNNNIELDFIFNIICCGLDNLP